MTHFKGWSRVDWGTWALPLYVTHLSYGLMSASRSGVGDARYKEHVVSVRVLCFGFFIEWSR